MPKGKGGLACQEEDVVVHVDLAVAAIHLKDLMDLADSVDHVVQVAVC